MYQIAERNDLNLALLSMYRVIAALILREIKIRFGRLKIGYIWALLEPILFICVLAIVFSIRRENVVYGMPVLIFLLTGIMPYILFRNTMNATMKACKANSALLYFPQVNPFELVIARTILEFITMFIVFVVIILLMHYGGIEQIEIESPLKLFILLVFTCMFGFSIGVGVGAWTPMFPIVEQVANILIGRPMFFISGIFFTVEMLPIWLREYLLLNPLFHLIEMFRSAFFVSFESKYVDSFYTISIITILLLVALLTQRALRKYVIQQ